MKKRHTLKYNAILMLTAIVWGMGFVAQSVGMDYIGPFLFTGARSVLAAVVALVAVLVLTAVSKQKEKVKSISYIKGGLICGCMLFVATSFQQVGMIYTAAGKAGFLTAMYIVLVPVISIFIGKRAHWNTWIGIIIAVAGLYFLSITGHMNMETGDLLVLISALFWSFHILCVEHFVPDLSLKDTLKMGMIQFAVCGVLGLIFAPIFDGHFTAGPLSMQLFISALPAVLYAGAISSGVGFTLQLIGQRYARATVAAVIMSLESVFSVIGGMLILHQILTGRETLGCVLMFVAVIITQLPHATKDKDRVT